MRVLCARMKVLLPWEKINDLHSRRVENWHDNLQFVYNVYRNQGFSYIPHNENVCKNAWVLKCLSNGHVCRMIHATVSWRLWIYTHAFYGKLNVIQSSKMHRSDATEILFKINLEIRRKSLEIETIFENRHLSLTRKV